MNLEPSETTWGLQSIRITLGFGDRPLIPTTSSWSPVWSPRFNSCSLGVFPYEDPHNRLSSFLELCDTIKYNGVSRDTIKLQLFPFSLRDKACTWFYALPKRSIETWDAMMQKFLTKFFPPQMILQLRVEIIQFWQGENELLYDAWDQFKDLLRRCT